MLEKLKARKPEFLYHCNSGRTYGACGLRPAEACEQPSVTPHMTLVPVSGESFCCAHGRASLEILQPLSFHHSTLVAAMDQPSSVTAGVLKVSKRAVHTASTP